MSEREISWSNKNHYWFVPVMCASFSYRHDTLLPLPTRQRQQEAKKWNMRLFIFPSCECPLPLPNAVSSRVICVFFLLSWYTCNGRGSMKIRKRVRCLLPSLGTGARHSSHYFTLHHAFTTFSFWLWYLLPIRFRMEAFPPPHVPPPNFPHRPLSEFIHSVWEQIRKQNRRTGVFLCW